MRAAAPPLQSAGGLAFRFRFARICVAHSTYGKALTMAKAVKAAKKAPAKAAAKAKPAKKVAAKKPAKKAKKK
ncbi:MAG: hypothetical protein ABUS57_22615 [Pseudomonadota bacterium]